MPQVGSATEDCTPPTLTHPCSIQCWRALAAPSAHTTAKHVRHSNTAHHPQHTQPQPPPRTLGQRSSSPVACELQSSSPTCTRHLPLVCRGSATVQTPATACAVGVVHAAHVLPLHHTYRRVGMLSRPPPAPIPTTPTRNHCHHLAEGLRHGSIWTGQRCPTYSNGVREYNELPSPHRRAPCTLYVRCRCIWHGRR